MSKPIKIEATLKGNLIEIPNVLCTISLPLVHDGKVPIACSFDARDPSPMQLGFEFSLAATVFDLGGNKQSEFRAGRVYWLKHTTEHYSSKRGNAVLHAEAVDFTTTRFFPKETMLEYGESSSFWLTPSVLLRPAAFIERRFDTGTKYDTHNVRTYDLPEMSGTRFESHLIYHDEPDRTFSASDHLVAVVHKPQESSIEHQLENLERFLTLTSFAERHRCVCYRYSARKPGQVSEHFRGDITIPEISKDRSFKDTLVDISHFEAFVATAYPRFLASTYGRYLSDAMMKLAYQSYRTLESEYIAYFAGLENLLNAYREQKVQPGILAAPEWKTFENDLRSFIKQHALFNKDPGKRALLYEKTGELNRLSLGAMLQDFTKDVGVDLAGLWPVAEKLSDGVNLYQIRNQIVHGRLLPHSGFDPLIAAKEHLRWVLERCVLALLGWEVAKSRACNPHLQRSNFADWARESRELRTAWQNAQAFL